MDEETKARYFLCLEESLLNVATDVPELVNHLGAQFSEILALSDLDGEVIKSGAILNQRNLALQNLGVAYRLSEKTLIDLAQGVETEWIVFCAMECQRLVKRVAGWCLGVELGNTKATLDTRSNAARKAGLASGKVRSESVRCTPDVVAKEYRTLMATGTEERNIAAKLATRFNVTSNHIRKLRKQAKNQT